MIHRLVVLSLLALAGCGEPGVNPAPTDGGADAPPVDQGAVDAGTDLLAGGRKTLALLAGGLGGPGSADDTGTAARFSAPYGVAGDGAGNLYIADTNNCTLRKMVIATGVVTTLAGTAGRCGSADGTAAAARFDGPAGVASDGAGTLYVADTQGHTIRKVVIATGAVTTLAGAAGQPGSGDGIAAAARFNTPHGVAADGAGNLYVADTANHTVRKIAIATATVSTLAGAPGQGPGGSDGVGAAARFNAPQGVVSDGAGNLFVADSGNHTIRKVVVATAAVGTLAGAAGQADTTDGVGAAARFFYPTAVAVDGAGDLFVADTENGTLREVVIATGLVTTLAGTAGRQGSVDAVGAAARFSTMYGVAVDGAGDLFVADTYNHEIRRVVVANGAVTTVAGAAAQAGSVDAVGAAARFDAPNAMVDDGAGNLYVADNRGTIRKVVIATGDVSTLAGTAGQYDSTDGVGAAAHFSRPNGLAVDGAGNLYVTEFEGCVVRKVVLATAAVTTLAGAAQQVGDVDATGSAARFGPLSGVTGDGAGNLYVVDPINFAIRRVEIATAQVTTLARIDTGSPWGIAGDGAGNLYVTDDINSTILKVAIATGAVTRLAGAPGQTGGDDGVGAAARFDHPKGIASDGAGSLYVADTRNHAIRKVAIAGGAVSTFAGVAGVARVHPGPLPAELAFPVAAAVTAASDVVVSDENSLLIIR